MQSNNSKTLLVFGKGAYGGFVEKGIEQKSKIKLKKKVRRNLFVKANNYLNSKRKMKSESQASIFKRKPSAQTAFTKVSLKSRDIPSYVVD